MHITQPINQLKSGQLKADNRHSELTVQMLCAVLNSLATALFWLVLGIAIQFGYHKVGQAELIWLSSISTI